MKKNLLVFASTFPRWPGDPEVPHFVFELARELTKHFNVFALAPHAAGAKKHETMDGVRVIRFAYGFPENTQTLAYGAGIVSNLKRYRGNVLKIPPFLLSQWRALKRTIHQHEIDIVNSHWMLPQGWVASFLPRDGRVKHVLTIHAAGLFALRRLPMGVTLARRIVEHSDLIYCVSSYNLQVLTTLTGTDPATRVLPMGIDTAFYRGEEDIAALRRELGLEAETIILYVGKLNEKKGVTYLLQAFPRIAEAHPGAMLVVVGSGILEDALRQEAEELGIASRVLFTGPRGREDVKKFYKAADVVAIPSIIDSHGETEGLPVVLMEALACGRPIVATRVGGAEDILEDGVNGFLVPQKDPEALAGKLLQVLASDATAISRNAEESAQAYDWTSIGRDYADNITRLYSEDEPAT